MLVEVRKYNSVKGWEERNIYEAKWPWEEFFNYSKKLHNFMTEFMSRLKTGPEWESTILLCRTASEECKSQSSKS